MPNKRDWLEKARKDVGLTQEQVTCMANETLQEIYPDDEERRISLGGYALYEGGKRNPRKYRAQAIAKVLGIDYTMFDKKKKNGT